MEAAILNDVTSRPRTDRTVSSNYMESDDTLEYTVHIIVNNWYKTYVKYIEVYINDSRILYLLIDNK